MYGVKEHEKLDLGDIFNVSREMWDTILETSVCVFTAWVQRFLHWPRQKEDAR